MSGGESSSVAEGGAGGFRPPFTAMQWQELEHQALIYKYLVAGMAVPPDLVIPIRQSFDSISARFFHQSSLGYCSYYGKKIDPEPGRCRRTDGKKWRCSKDAYPDSKYCERHMHRGRNRSRKHVESQSTSQSLSAVISHGAPGSTGGTGSFQNLPLQSIVDNKDSLLGSNASKWQMEPVSYGVNNKEYRHVYLHQHRSSECDFNPCAVMSDFRYFHGNQPEADKQGFLPEGSGGVRALGLDRNIDPSLIPSYGAHLQSDSCQPHMLQDFELMSNSAMARQRQQHCFFGSDVGSLGALKQESHAIRPFWEDGGPKDRASWADLDDHGYEKNSFATTQLSISARRSYSPNGESTLKLRSTNTET
ncbi:hypothetical protein RHMOL_Rhmol07G0167100 [Rhododendron molle]|uniref:Uncharacterized protein n=1 Tax=Rhododendron molle TaxID=49168 RepID=A0ACC0N3C9_RHOML|nr:hypothetical protein RHMOL_Rhmol07G0167100 [Rhododendron molle]